MGAGSLGLVLSADGAEVAVEAVDRLVLRLIGFALLLDALIPTVGALVALGDR
jgi:hypothetical protein